MKIPNMQGIVPQIVPIDSHNPNWRDYFQGTVANAWNLIPIPHIAQTLGFAKTRRARLPVHGFGVA